MTRRKPLSPLPVVSLLMSLATFAAAQPGTLIGTAQVVDGDTLRVAGIPVRLHGIDAPEASQACDRPSAKPWRCGEAATNHLVELVLNREVECVSTDTDRYGRLIAVCSAAGVELNRAMVSSGLAWAFLRYSDDYKEQEIQARRAGLGTWQGGARPIAPWDYRAGIRVATAAPQDGCVIKGNVQRDGDRVYHTEASPWYTRTRINTAKGERWFCNESEAIAAGWRAARRY